MRPESIRKFDMLYLGGLAVSLIGSILTAGAMTTQAESELAKAGVVMDAGGVMWGAVAFSMVIGVALWFLVARQRIEVIKWVLVVFFVWGAIGLPFLFADGVQLYDVVTLVAFAMQAAALWFLFRPDAKAWFAEKRGTGDRI